jgi:hypothetical protein
MKAKILKIAGVKDEKEFYKKYPTEEAFMKKHGHKLKKAVGGAELDAIDYMNNGSMPFDNPIDISQSAFGGIDKFINSDFGATVNNKKTKKGFDWNKLNQISPQLGTIVGSIQQINQDEKDLRNAEMYSKISDLTRLAASSRPERIQKKYVRPEDQLSQTVSPLGVGTDYLQAANGAEIANYYNSPDTIYTDGGFEPLNDSNVKQYKKGGKLKKAANGFDWSSLSGQVGGIGGALGSAIGGGKGRGGAYSQLGSTVGRVAGSLLPFPGGDVLGEFALGTVGGIIDASGQNKMQKAEDAINNNLNAGILQSGGQNIQSQNKSFMKQGGWVSNDWQPQVITKFGDLDVSQVHSFAHDGMPEYRAGGHLKEYTPPTERAMYTDRAEDGTQMAFGGDVRVGKGYMKPLSDDVYEAVGPSHKNGGMPIVNGDNEVEMEGKETIRKTYGDGGPMDDGSITIFGNRVINKYAADFVGIDPNKKYKTQSKDMALDQTKFENKSTKNFELANNMKALNSIDKIEQQTLLLNGKQFAKKAEGIKDKLTKLAIYQNETDDIAKSAGLDINAFDKGIMKPIKQSDKAAFGAKMETAADGAKKPKYDPEFENFIDKAMQLEQANSSAAGDYRGGAYNYGTANRDNGAYNTPEKAKDFYYKNYWSKVKDLPAGLRTRALQMAINMGDPYGELMVAAGKMSLDERRGTVKERKDKSITGNKAWEANKADIIKAYNEDPQGFLGKLDTEQNRYYDSYIANNPSDINKDTRKEFFDDYTGLARFASQDYIPSKNITPIAQPAAVTPISRTNTPPPIQLGDFEDPGMLQQLIPETRSNSFIPAPSRVPVSDLPTYDTTGLQQGMIPEGSRNGYIPNLADQISKARYDQSAQNTTMLDDVKVVAPMGTSAQFPSPTDEEGNYYMPISEPNGSGLVDPRNAGWDGTDEYQYKYPSNDSNQKPTVPTSKTNNWGNVLNSALSSVAPFFRPGVGKPLDPSQLMGEMYALGNNQIEPVQAQLYSPMLQAQPYRVSLQDQLNEVTAQTRAAERMAQGNPSALAMIAAQGEQAKSKILGEQFRMNQAESSRAAETNRAQWNDAQQKNLGILDQQYARQEESKSKTKAQTIEALKSISTKQAQNKYENLQGNIAANMYNYRFTPEGVAYNLNPPAQFNPYGGVGKTGKGQIPEGMSPTWESDDSGNPVLSGYKKKKETARNGSLVKAFKNL